MPYLQVDVAQRVYWNGHQIITAHELVDPVLEFDWIAVLEVRMMPERGILLIA